MGWTYIEPRETAPRGSQEAFVGASSTFLEVFHGPDPFLGCNGPEVDFLLVQVGSNICAKQTEEGGNGKGFVTISNDFEVDAVVVVVVRKEGNGSVDRDHEEDSNDVPLLPWFQIMRCVHCDEE